MINKSFLRAKIKPQYLFFTILLVVILAGAFLRFNALSFSSDLQISADLNRDLIVLDLMHRFGEYPLVGPDGLLGPQSNSPFYFYLLYIPTVIFGNGFYQLLFFNFSLQLFAIGAFFIFVRSFFGNKTALIATALYSGFEIFTNQSSLLWQPNIMQVLFVTSLMCLGLFYNQKREYLLWSSLVFFSLALAVHSSLWPILPVYILVVIIILRSQSAKQVIFIRGLGVLTGSLLLLFGTLIHSCLGAAHACRSGIRTERLNFPPEDLWSLLVGQTALFFERFFYQLSDLTLAIYLLLLVIGLVWSLSKWQSRYYRVVTGLVLLAFLVTAVAVSFAYRTTEVASFPFRYYAPLYPLLILFIALLIKQIDKFTKPTIATVVHVGLVLLLIFQNGPNPPYSEIRHVGAVTFYQAQPFFHLEPHPGAVWVKEKVTGEGLIGDFDAHVLRGRYGVDWYSRERVTSLAILDSQVQQVTLDPQNPRGYSPLKEIKKLFVYCPEAELEDCRQQTQSAFPDSHYIDSYETAEMEGVILYLRKGQ